MAKRARSRYLGVKHSLVSPIPGIVALQTGDGVNLTVPVAVPATEDWLKVLAGPELSWWHTFVIFMFLVQGTSYVAELCISCLFHAEYFK
jgi:Fatty acid synthase meander beta sheet domain